MRRFIVLVLGSFLVTGVLAAGAPFAGNGSVADSTFGVNCAVISRRSDVNAEKNFWGSAQGPGVDPADRVCALAGNIDTVPFLTRPVAIVNQTAR